VRPTRRDASASCTAESDLRSASRRLLPSCARDVGASMLVDLWWLARVLTVALLCRRNQCRGRIPRNPFKKRPVWRWTAVPIKSKRHGYRWMTCFASRNFRSLHVLDSVSRDAATSRGVCPFLFRLSRQVEFSAQSQA
jgi:hypothetical protein